MKAIRLSTFATQKDEITWLVEGLLADVGWTLLVGQQGLGKTTLALQLCAALQAGKPFMGMRTVQRDICYIQADSETTEWRAMVQRIAPKSLGWTIIDVERQCLNNPIYVAALDELISKLKPGFIVFDSLYNLTSSAINSESVLIPINTMKSLANKVPWLLIHHPPHSELRAAGHHSLPANCSNEWHMLKSKLRIAKGRLVALKELAIVRGEDGLWIPKDEDDSSDGKGYLDRYPMMGGSV